MVDDPLDSAEGFKVAAAAPGSPFLVSLFLFD